MRGFATLLRDERGAQTVEFVLWVPIITALLLIVADAATLYITHNEMWNVARDTARRMSTGQLASAEEAEAYAVAAMELRDYPYLIDAVFDPAGDMEVAIGLSFDDLLIPGYATLAILGGRMTARVAMRANPNLVLAGQGGGNGNGNGNGTNR